MGTSLIVQWLRLHAPKAGVLFPSLVGELYLTCPATKTCCNQISIFKKDVLILLAFRVSKKDKFVKVKKKKNTHIVTGSH